MSKEYDELLAFHKTNIKKAYFWIQCNMPDILKGDYDYYSHIHYHDNSKRINDEYVASDSFLFGTKDENTRNNYRQAQLLHRHRNPHHWEYWVLHTSNISPTPLDMDYPYIIEMICDWWSFSWAEDNLFLIFKWYDEHKNNIMMSDKTKEIVEDILDKIYNKLIKEMLL